MSYIYLYLSTWQLIGTEGPRELSLGLSELPLFDAG
jgi:hypothetical protein